MLNAERYSNSLCIPLIKVAEHKTFKLTASVRIPLAVKFIILQRGSLMTCYNRMHTGSNGLELRALNLNSYLMTPT